jgi:Domain of unknown function (DUF4381)
MPTYQPTVDLTQLRDVVTPPPVSYAPQTVGWYILGGMVLALIAWLVSRWLAHRRATRYRRDALDQLRTIEAMLSRGVAASVIVELDALTKRVALVTFGREAVAPLSGREWLSFLDRTARTTAFTAGDARPLGELPYQPVSEREAVSVDRMKALAVVVRRWIRSHRVPV